MSDPTSTATPSATVRPVYTVRLADGRQFGPAPTDLLTGWVREGRIPRDAVLIPADGGPPVPVLDHPALTAYLNAPPVAAGAVPAIPDGGLSTLIPYRNGRALAAYYLGIFALAPGFGAVLGPLALIFGVLGYRYSRRRPEAKGAVHAWVGIIMGGLVTLAYLALVVWIVLLATGKIR